MSGPPKAPQVNIEYYEQPKTIGCFETIINSLRVDLDKEGADTSFNSPDLTYFTAHFQKFQLDHLGKEATEKAKRHRKPFLGTGVPFGLFSIHQLSTSSSLYFILKAAYKFKSNFGITDWRLDATEEAPTYLQMVQVIKKALAATSFDLEAATIPRVLFDASVDEHKKKKLTLLIESLGGTFFFFFRSRAY